MKDRMRGLMLNAAKCFDECRNPFETDELSKHNVTADECIDLSTGLGQIIRYVLQLEKFQKDGLAEVHIILKSEAVKTLLPSELQEIWDKLVNNCPKGDIRNIMNWQLAKRFVPLASLMFKAEVLHPFDRIAKKVEAKT
jgi:hypothetical protein